MGTQSSAVTTQNIYSDSLHFLTLGTDEASYLERQAHQLPCAAPLASASQVTLHLWAVG